MMAKMREWSKVFIILVALAFIALMIFQWGAGYSGRSRQSDVVGEVNGNKLKYSHFSKMYQEMYDEERTRTGKESFSDEDLQRMRDQVWERFIQQTLFKAEMEKLGISVSDSEIVYQIYNYPLDDFKRHPAFQTNGVFDINKYHQAFNNPNIPWLKVENYYRQQIPYLKLQNIITSTALVSDQEVRDAFEQANEKAKVEYLGVTIREFNSPSFKVTEDEVAQYYTAHKEDFKQNEKRQLAYVLFPVKTTAQDTLRLMQEFDEIKSRLKKGENFNALAIEYSEAPSVKQDSGRLGYFDGKSMPKAFSEAAFSAKVGQVVGPVKTSLGFHLIKIEDKKIDKGQKKVKASHILIKVTPAPSRVEDVESKARFFSEDAKDNGFELQAQKDSLQVLKTSLFEESGDFIPGIGRNFAIKNFAFSSHINDVSGTYKTDQGYIVVSLINIQKAGYKSLKSVKRLVENRIRLEKAKDKARSFANGFAEQVTSRLSFKAIAAGDTSRKIHFGITPPFTINGSIPGIGYSIPFNATAFSLKVGQRSGRIDTERGFYYLDLLEKTAFDSTKFAAQKNILRQQLLNRKRSQIFALWYAQLKKKADIVDNRKMFNL